jgi:predicted short-subunit dehydrogenase-like oxidoreductase (DUF2520 family)
MKQKIAIAGIGNLGWNLAQRLHEQDFEVKQIIAEKNQRRSKFTKKIDAILSSDVSELKEKIDILFLCIPDDKIAEVAAKVPNEHVAIVHCSGSTPAIEGLKNPTGVLYPFQTFTKFFEVDWSHVPVFIESKNKRLKNSLMRIGEELSGNVQELSFEQRRTVHLAGVVGANFTNHLLYLTKAVMDEKNVPFEVLMPLLEETVRKAFAHGPAGAQTGPARRNDQKVIKTHIDLLENHSSLRQFYEQFSASLTEEYKS